jgi:hypothetical protein
LLTILSDVLLMWTYTAGENLFEALSFPDPLGGGNRPDRSERLDAGVPAGASKANWLRIYVDWRQADAGAT